MEDNQYLLLYRLRGGSWCSETIPSPVAAVASVARLSGMIDDKVEIRLIPLDKVLALPWKRIVRSEVEMEDVDGGGPN